MIGALCRVGHICALQHLLLSAMGGVCPVSPSGLKADAMGVPMGVPMGALSEVPSAAPSAAPLAAPSGGVTEAQPVALAATPTPRAPMPRADRFDMFLGIVAHTLSLAVALATAMAEETVVGMAEETAVGMAEGTAEGMGRGTAGGMRAGTAEASAKSTLLWTRMGLMA